MYDFVFRLILITGFLEVFFFSVFFGPLCSNGML